MEPASSLPAKPGCEEFLQILASAEGAVKQGAILGALEKYQLDCLTLPSSAYTIICIAAVAGMSCCHLSKTYGLTIIKSRIIAVPLGFYPEGTPVKYYEQGTLIKRAPKIPFALYFVGRAFDEDKLIACKCLPSGRSELK